MGCAVAAGTLVSCGKSKSSSPKKADTSKLIGEWRNDDLAIGIQSDTDGWIGTDQDVSDVLTVNDDGSINMSPKVLGKDDYDFDGERLVIEADRKAVINMKKTEPGSPDEVAGVYKVTGGQIYDSIYKGYNKRAKEDNGKEIEKGTFEVYIDLGKESSSMQIRIPCSLELYDENMFIEPKVNFSEDMFFGMVEYELNGDTLKLESSNGKKQTLKKKV